MAARRDLGLEYEEQIAAGLAERVEQVAWYREAEARHRTEIKLAEIKDERKNRGQQLALSIVSLGTGIPITAIAALNVDPGLFGVVAAWGGIVGVNAVFALSGRRSRRSRQD